jgi:hypothetical protein
MRAGGSIFWWADWSQIISELPLRNFRNSKPRRGLSPYWRSTRFPFLSDSCCRSKIWENGFKSSPRLRQIKTWSPVTKSFVSKYRRSVTRRGLFPYGDGTPWWFLVSLEGCLKTSPRSSSPLREASSCFPLGTK